MKKTILECTVGSTVHGVAVKDGLEDLDLMAVVLEAPKQFVGFYQQDAWVTRTKPQGVRSEAGDVDHTAYGLRKFLGLALRGNPSILLAFFAPESHTHVLTTEGRELRKLTEYVVSKQVYAPYRGYMRQQHERLIGMRGQRNVVRPELIEAYGFDTKYAAHIIRLGLQGEELLLTGRISLPMPEDQRGLVTNIRSGVYSLSAVSEMIIGVEQRIVDAHAASKLPERPDQKTVETWMIQTYLNHWSNA